MSTALFPSVYMGSISYFHKISACELILIEHYEHFQKQTHRNRCEICGANGKLVLSIPLQKHSEKTLTKDICISYNDPWQKIHWKSIQSSYRSSPYFEYYEDDFRPFYEKKTKFLIDFNQHLQELILNMLSIKTRIDVTSQFDKIPSGMEDLRSLFSSKNASNENMQFTSPVYMQVFQPRLPFIPNLSIVDLLFNEGPNAKEML